ncbi:MAG: hypothetical protein AB1437_05165 [Pseudomonadota bacterium]
MKLSLKTSVLLSVVAAAAPAASAQEDCQARINKIEKIGDIQAALSCVQGQITSEAERIRNHTEKTKNQLLLQTVDQLELVTTNVRQVSLKDPTNGTWKQIPDSADAKACYLSAVRLPAQGLCQVTYQSSLARWAYNVSDPASAGFTCTATCVWMDIRRKAQAAAGPDTNQQGGTHP